MFKFDCNIDKNTNIRKFMRSYKVSQKYAENKYYEWKNKYMKLKYV